MGERAVVTGAGAVTSLGGSVAETWAALLAGAGGVRPVEGFDAGGFTCRSAAQVRHLDPEALGVAARDARLMGRPALMLLKAGKEAIAQADLGAAGVTPERVGFFAGMGMVDPAPDDLRNAVLASRGRTGVDYERFFADGYGEIYPLWPLAMLNNVGFCLAARHLGAGGENAVFSPGADAAVLALAEATTAVTEGRALFALIGGASESVSAFGLARAHIAGGWAVGNGEPALGEGSGVLVVEAEAAARARGASLLATVPGWGFGFQTAGSGAAAGAMGRAMERAGLEPTDIDAVLLHRESVGTAWEEERHAVTEVFGSRAGAPLRLASKRALGHTLAGAAALDAVLALRVLTTGIVPRALLCPRDERPPHSLPGGSVSFPQRPRRVLVNARSWSGHAASLILETVD